MQADDRSSAENAAFARYDLIVNSCPPLSYRDYRTTLNDGVRIAMALIGVEQRLRGILVSRLIKNVVFLERHLKGEIKLPGRGCVAGNRDAQNRHSGRPALMYCD